MFIIFHFWMLMETGFIMQWCKGTSHIDTAMQNAVQRVNTPGHSRVCVLQEDEENNRQMWRERTRAEVWRWSWETRGEKENKTAEVSSFSLSRSVSQSKRESLSHYVWLCVCENKINPSATRKHNTSFVKGLMRSTAALFSILQV